MSVKNTEHSTKEDWAYLLKTISHALKESDPRFFNNLNAKIREMKQSSWDLLKEAFFLGDDLNFLDQKGLSQL